jgi:hypothetical protein
MQNKVVHTLARAMQELGAPTVRFNFRGVGASAARMTKAGERSTMWLPPPIGRVGAGAATGFGSRAFRRRRSCAPGGAPSFARAAGHRRARRSRAWDLRACPAARLRTG